jgi:hypothetical protein
LGWAVGLEQATAFKVLANLANLNLKLSLDVLILKIDCAPNERIEWNLIPVTNLPWKNNLTNNLTT